jgi:hypothetical protein
MRKFRNYLVVFFGFVIFISVLVLLSPHETLGQRGGGPPGGMNVKVVNENTEPVPVNLVQSTETDVNVVNMPTEPISVVQTGFVDVNVANMPTEPISVVQSGNVDVNVVNMPDEPIEVNCVQSIEHFQETVILSFSHGENGKFGGFLVTSGKRLVIEHVSIRAALTPGQRLFETKITALQVGGGSSKEHFLVTEFQGHRPGIADYYGASQPIRLYAIGGVSIGAFRTDDVGTSQVNVTVSGYLVDY